MEKTYLEVNYSEMLFVIVNGKERMKNVTQENNAEPIRDLNGNLSVFVKYTSRHSINDFTGCACNNFISIKITTFSTSMLTFILHLNQSVESEKEKKEHFFRLLLRPLTYFVIGNI